MAKEWKHEDSPGSHPEPMLKAAGLDGLLGN